MGKCAPAAVVSALIAFLPVSAAALDFWRGEAGATTPLTPGQFYLSVGGAGGIYHLPRFEIFQRVNFANTAVFGRIGHDAEVPVFGAGGEFGYVFRPGTLPTWLGERVRIGVGGSFLQGEKTDRQLFSEPSGNQAVKVYSVSGTNNLPFGFGTFGDRSQLTTEFDAYEVALRLKSDIALGERVALTPSIGVFGGQSRERYEFVYGLIVVGGERKGFVNETNRSWRVGGDVGLHLTGRVTDVVALSFGGRAGVFHVNTRMRGDDCFSQITAPPGTPCVFDGTGFQTSVRDSRSAVGFRGILNAGVHLDGGWIMVSLLGFASLDTAVPTINNPQTGLAPPTTAGPARIGYSTGYSAGGMFNVRLSLY